MNCVTLEVFDQIATVTINRPKALNALNTQTLTELRECFAGLEERKDVRVVILTGAGGKAFVAGADISEMVDATPADRITEANLGDSARRIAAQARELGAVVAVTGAVDLVTDGTTCYAVRNGRPEMGRVTGTGCQLSALLTAFLAVQPSKPLEAALGAVCAMGLAGELAWERMAPGDGNAAYRGRIIDAVYHLSGQALEKGANYEALPL